MKLNNIERTKWSEQEMHDWVYNNLDKVKEIAESFTKLENTFGYNLQDYGIFDNWEEWMIDNMNLTNEEYDQISRRPDWFLESARGTPVWAKVDYNTAISSIVELMEALDIKAQDLEIAIMQKKMGV